MYFLSSTLSLAVTALSLPDIGMLDDGGSLHHRTLIRDAVFVRAPDLADGTAVVAVVAAEPRKTKGLLLELALAEASVKIERVTVLFEEAMPPDVGLGINLAAVDMTADGFDELIVYGSELDTRIFQYKEGQYRLRDDNDAGLPGSIIKIVPIDVGCDGSTDLLIKTFELVDVREADPEGVWLAADAVVEASRWGLLRNQQGRLEEEELWLLDDHDEWFFEFVAIDLNRNGCDDLLRVRKSGTNAIASVIDVFISHDDGFEQVELPLQGFDVLFGLERVAGCMYDLAGDGAPKLIVSGTVSELDIGLRGTMTMVYSMSKMKNNPNHVMLEYDARHQLPDIRGRWWTLDITGNGQPELLGVGLTREGERVLVGAQPNGLLHGGRWRNGRCDWGGRDWGIGSVVPVRLHGMESWILILFPNVSGRPVGVVGAL